MSRMGRCRMVGVGGVGEQDEAADDNRALHRQALEAVRSSGNKLGDVLTDSSNEKQVIAALEGAKVAVMGAKEIKLSIPGAL
eukprot:3895834-Pyramimonas_sp.AAC.1